MALKAALAVASVVFIADRALKIWVVEGLGLREHFFIEVWDPYLNLTMAWNQGVNFGLFDFGDAGRWVLVSLAVLISAALLWWAWRSRGRWTPLGVGLIVGGALGNAWDRVQWGAVADFINMSCCGITNPYAFNLADASIFAGAAVLILLADRDARPHRRRNARGRRDAKPHIR